MQYFKYMMSFNYFLNESKTTLYHGSDKLFDEFDVQYVSNRGHNTALGPGFYLTPSKELAMGYGRYLYEISLAPNSKFVSSVKRAFKKELMFMITSARDYKSTIYDFSGLPNVFKMLNDYSNANHQFIDGIWAEFYSYDSSLFLKNMTSLGYDGVLMPSEFESPTGFKRAQGEIYLIYNPSVLTIDSIYDNNLKTYL